MENTGLFVIDKIHGSIHEIGTDTHDSFWTDGSGVVHYHNLQNGDGCDGSGYENNKESGYAFLPSMYDEYSQPDKCIMGDGGTCCYPIEDCMDCPKRKQSEQ